MDNALAFKVYKRLLGLNAGSIFMSVSVLYTDDADLNDQRALLSVIVLAFSMLQ